MSKIEWTGKTWNPIVGCSKISQGCKNCYAEKMARRLKGMGHESYSKVIGNDGKWNGDIAVNLSAALGRLRKTPTIYFVGSMTDIFHKNVTYAQLYSLWDTMRDYPQHVFQILTKRADRMQSMVQRLATEFSVLPNVWLGVSAENQECANERIPLLLDTPAALRFVSAEPLLGPIDFAGSGWLPDNEYKEEFDEMAIDFADDIDEIVAACKANGVFVNRRIAQLAWMQHSYDVRAGWLTLAEYLAAVVKNRHFIDWVIVGGESGPGARPMNPNWVRSIRDQCKRHNTLFFFKQWGEWSPAGDHKANGFEPPVVQGRVCTNMRVIRVGKKVAGRMLDGCTHSEIPSINATG